MNEDGQLKLTIMLTELAAKMQVLLDKQDELADNISKIKEAVYNPDQGLYARLTRLDARIDVLESWKGLNSRLLWLVGSVSVGLLLNTAWQALF